MALDRILPDGQLGQMRALRYLDSQKSEQRLKVESGSVRTTFAETWRQKQRELEATQKKRARLKVARIRRDDPRRPRRGAVAIDADTHEAPKEPLWTDERERRAPEAKALAEEAAARLEEIELARVYSFGRRLHRTAALAA